MSVLLSVIIPTKDRAIYCIETIKVVLDNLGANSELVVQDNSVTNNLQKLVQGINDPRLIYRYNDSGKHWSFVENFNKGMELANGKYVCVLGDDDAILKQAYDVVSWMERENIDSVCASQITDYIWPNDVLPEAATGKLHIPQFTGNVKPINVQKQLNKLLSHGLYLYQIYGLPRVYHGIVRKSCMEKIKQLTGHYFGGLTPDIYATLALANVVKSHYQVDYPITLAGACPASFTVAGQSGAHTGQLSKAPHFENRGIYEWDKIIPAYYSVETIWAESAIKAIKETGNERLMKKFNLYYFLIKGILANRKHILWLTLNKTILLPSIAKISNLTYWPKLFGQAAIMFFIAIWNRTYKKHAVINDVISHTYYKVNNLNAAISATIIKTEALKLKV